MVWSIALEPKQTFWIMTLNLMIESAAIEWCKVFGSHKQSTHWTKSIPAAAQSAVRMDLLNAIGLTEVEWERYRKGVVAYRDEMVAHHDLSASVANYPNLDIALKAAEFLFRALRNTADPDSLGDIPRSLGSWSERVAANMSPIVRKAFAASAELGPNVPTNSH